MKRVQGDIDTILKQSIDLNKIERSLKMDFSLFEDLSDEEIMLLYDTNVFEDSGSMHLAYCDCKDSEDRCHNNHNHIAHGWPRVPSDQACAELIKHFNSFSECNDYCVSDHAMAGACWQNQNCYCHTYRYNTVSWTRCDL